MHGQIYHLAATKRKKKNIPLQTANASEDLSHMGLLRKMLAKSKVRTPIEPRVDDLSSPSSPASIKERRRKTKFVAYHVGQTLYSREEVDKLARATIWQIETNDMSSYDFLQNNCQHFVLALVRRIVMTQRKALAVGGTRLQIAQWSVGLPGYELDPWLSPWRRRLLLLPKSYSRTFPARWPLAYLVPDETALHLATTLPRILHSLLWEKSWAQRIQDLRSSSSILREIRRQWKTLHKPAWPKHDISALLAWGMAGLLLDEIATRYLFVTTGLPMLATSTVDVTVAFVSNLVLAAALVSPWILLLGARLFMNRGSLTIQQMDLKRNRPGQHETSSAFASGSMDGSEAEEPSDDSSVDDDDDQEEGFNEKRFDERLFPFSYADIKALEATASDNAEDLESGQEGPPLYDSHDDVLFRPPLPPRP